MGKRFSGTKTWVMLLALILFSASARPDIVVIVNAASNVEQLSRDDVVNIFMGRYRKLPDGTSVMPLDIKGDAPEKKDFYKALLDKNLPEVNAYWARLVFSGRTSPPLILEDADQVLKKVTLDPTVIGYTTDSGTREGVKIVYRLPVTSTP
ncbi:MAG: hypothetical protein PHH11_04230 [Methylomonas sp.]|nr:hypothetical protein [Methylomonas sp.]